MSPGGQTPEGLRVLFEPVAIGPVTTRNRFYQVPHGSGMARSHPRAMSRMRAVKAEGGWGVVCTEQCDFHPTSNHLRELQLWDDGDRRRLDPLVEGIHAHGSLAGIELSHNGSHVANLESRVAPLAPSSLPVRGLAPVTAREMDKKDIADLRRWHRAAVLRAVQCGFDIVYVYAGHGQTLPAHFLSAVLNRRTDEYGGSLANRTRLLRELLEDAREIAEGRSAIALRFGADMLPHQDDEEGRQDAAEAVALLAEIPDLWDVTLTDFGRDGAASRTATEGHEAPWTAMVKRLTSKPVAGVGWFTSPQVMADQVLDGALDLVGAARASIADPFLPEKVSRGDLDSIRECIGCNVCLASDAMGVPLVCTQNPTMGEEWRRDWHPERTSPASTRRSVLVVGGGPAGLEAARVAAERGHSVTLCEAGDVLGGHVMPLTRLPGLAAWGRVVDWRARELRRLGVDVALDTRVTAQDIVNRGADHVAVVTGAVWRRDGVGHLQRIPPRIVPALLTTPDEVLAGQLPEGRIVVFDDDHYVMAASICLLLAAEGREVVYASPGSMVAAYTQYTNEQPTLHAALLQECASVVLLSGLTRVDRDACTFQNVYTSRETTVACDSVVLVTGRVPRTELWAAVRDLPQPIHRVGDALSPGTIAAAVHNGHLFGRELSTDANVAGAAARDGHGYG